MTKLIYSIDCGDGFSSAYTLETLKNEVNDSRIEMRFYGTQWNKPFQGEVAVKLKDHGNGINIKLQRGTKIKLDYDEAEELAAVLKFYNEDSGCSQFVSKTTKLKEIE